VVFPVLSAHSGANYSAETGTYSQIWGLSFQRSSSVSTDKHRDNDFNHGRKASFYSLPINYSLIVFSFDVTGSTANIPQINTEKTATNICLSRTHQIICIQSINEP
jgi:hypothetical protein